MTNLDTSYILFTGGRGLEGALQGQRSILINALSLEEAKKDEDIVD